MFLDFIMDIDFYFFCFRLYFVLYFLVILVCYREIIEGFLNIFKLLFFLLYIGIYKVVIFKKKV